MNLELPPPRYRSLIFSTTTSKSLAMSVQAVTMPNARPGTRRSSTRAELGGGSGKLPLVWASATTKPSLPAAASLEKQVWGWG